jgi:folate-binding Fe-S cluster repair protein YgfZ
MQGYDSEKTLQAQQMEKINKTIEKIEKNLTGCSNQGQVLSAVQ